MGSKIFDVGKFKRGNMRRFQHDRWRHSRFQRLLPALSTQAPTIARTEAREIKLWDRRTEIVAHHFGEFKEFGGGLHANRMNSQIVATGPAATIAIEAGHWIRGAVLKFSAEDILGR